MSNNILTTLDNLVLNVEKVTQETFEKFGKDLSRLETFSKLPEIFYSVGKGYSEYHHNLNIGIGSGGLRIGYKHNSAKQSNQYTMRLEFNPSKQSEENYGEFWSLFKKTFKDHVKLIKQFDIAFDIAAEPREIISVSLTGRQRTILKDTVYFGSRGNHGRLKIYNKKKEIEDKQKIKMDPNIKLTRIEYTVKLDKGVTAQMLSKADLKINEQYQLSLLSLDKFSGEVKSMLIAFHNGWVQWNEFTRTSKMKIKKALDNMTLLDIDKCYLNARKEIIESITKYFK